MQRHLHPLPMWMTVAAITAAGVLVVFLAFTLRQESTFDDATERVHQSSLLPEDWSTYGADVWSIGYPNTWEIDSTLLGTGGPTTTRQLHFHPASERGTTLYLLVETEARTPDEIEAAFAEIASVTRSEFRFAGYPAVKFSTYRRDEYFIAYKDEVTYRIATDRATDDEIGIMLATFQFME